MSEEMQAATPAEQVTPAEQDAQVEQTSAEETTEQTQEQNNETQEEKAKREPWFQKRIGELTREKYEARRAAEEARQQAEQYRAYLAQIQQGQQPQQQQQQPQVDVRTLAQQEAARMVAEQRLNESINKVYSTGKTEFQDFDQAVANLQLVGAGREFVELAVTSDAGHKLIHHLGSDLEEAARILALPPVQMARELTKLEMKLSQPVPKPVSKAPAPITPIGTSKTTDNDVRDDLPIEEWVRRERERTRRK